jgi:hypothetical protein
VNAYEWKQERRRERLEARAARLAAEGEARFKSAAAAIAGIEPGQPILVGHHSEKRHRRALQRHDQAMRSAFAKMDAAAEAARRAAAAGSGGISSDDPDAVAKLADKRTALEVERDEMKAANVWYRKHKTLAGAPVSEACVKRAEVGLRYHGIPFPSYALTNIGARIREASKRAARIVAVQAMDASEETVAGCRITIDPEDNRITVTFPARLSREAYKAVRGFGFLWSPTRNGFTRKIGANAAWAARHLAEKYGAVTG